MYSYMRYVCVECGQLIGRYGRDTALTDNPTLVYLYKWPRLPQEVSTIQELTDNILAHEALTGHSNFKREIAVSTRTVEMDIAERNPA